MVVLVSSVGHSLRMADLIWGNEKLTAFRHEVPETRRFVGKNILDSNGLVN